MTMKPLGSPDEYPLDLKAQWALAHVKVIEGAQAASSTTACETPEMSGPSTPSPLPKPTLRLSHKDWLYLVSKLDPPASPVQYATGPLGMSWNGVQYRWTSRRNWSLPESALPPSLAGKMGIHPTSPAKTTNAPYFPTLTFKTAHAKTPLPWDQPSLTLSQGVELLGSSHKPSAGASSGWNLTQNTLHSPSNGYHYDVEHHKPWDAAALGDPPCNIPDGMEVLF